ncbi:unnamed protein product [Bathycoccus prasinos]
MKKGRFVDTTTTKLAEWTKKVGTKIKETAEALEVEFNDDGGGGGGQHRQYSHQPRKGNGKGQFTNTANDNRFAALRGASSQSNSQSSFIEEGDEERDVFLSEKKAVTLVVNVFETADMLEEKQKLEKEFKEKLRREREEFDAKMREMERKLEEEKTKRKESVTTPTMTPTKKGTSKKKTDDDDDDDDNAAAPASPVVLAAAIAQSPSSLEIEMKAIKNVTQTLKNQLKERDERIAKMLEKEKEVKELNESLTQKNSQMQTSLEVLRKKQKENDAAKDRDMLETSELKDLKRMKEKQEKELEREKKMKEVVQKKYEKAHEDWLDVTTNQANDKKELLRLQKSEEVKTEKIETLEEQLLQTKLELEDFKHCRKERDNALQKLSEVREEIVDLKHEKSAYENNAEDLRLVNEAREVAEKALVEESKKTIDLERKLRELSEEKANKNNSSNRDSHNNNNNKKNTRNHDDPESASATPKQDDGKGRTTPFSSTSSSIKSEETDRDKNKTAQGSHESSSTIADLKSEIAALKNQLETLSREKDDKIAVIDSDRAQLQRQLEEAKKTAAKLIKEKLESIQTDFKRSAETHAKETGLLKEEIADLEEDRNEWKRKCEKARDETDVVRKRAREMLVEKEEELERALFNDGKATTTDGKISSIGRKAASSSLTFLEEDDDQEQTEKKKNSSSKPPPREVTTTTLSSSSSESDFLYLKNILLQYLTTNERLVHERLVPVVTTLLKCSDEERAKVIAARVNMKPSSSSGGSKPNTPTRSAGSGVRLFNAFFRT